MTADALRAGLEARRAIIAAQELELAGRRRNGTPGRREVDVRRAAGAMVADVARELVAPRLAALSATQVLALEEVAPELLEALGHLADLVATADA